jgi:L,D-peptidoglycan transpeptidase YkuD (ErfK/YbiS/YcfS/YnhG family)
VGARRGAIFVVAGLAAVACASAHSSAVTGLASPQASARPRIGPSRVTNVATRLRTLPAGTRQVVVVHSAGYAATTATVETFQKVDGGWRPALRAMTGRIGMRGFTDHKVEGDLATPTGVYAIGATMYGIAADPGVRYRYHRLVAGDYWDENAASPGYNSFVHGPDPGAGSEALWRTAPQYTYLAVINYNIPAVVAKPPRGSGIFLHKIHPGYATAGCVALPGADLVSVLRWLDPAAAPRVVMAPRQVLGRY